MRNLGFQGWASVPLSDPLSLHEGEGVGPRSLCKDQLSFTPWNLFDCPASQGHLWHLPFGDPCGPDCSAPRMTATTAREKTGKDSKPLRILAQIKKTQSAGGEWDEQSSKADAHSMTVMSQKLQSHTGWNFTSSAGIAVIKNVIPADLLSN